MVLNDQDMPSYKKVHHSLFAFKGMVLSPVYLIVRLRTYLS